MNLTDTTDGWDKEKRKWWKLADKLNRKQSAKMEQYTKLGYKKMKIPTDLYQVNAKTAALQAEYALVVKPPVLTAYFPVLP